VGAIEDGALERDCLLFYLSPSLPCSQLLVLKKDSLPQTGKKKHMTRFLCFG